MAVRNKPLGRIDVNVIGDTWEGSTDIHVHPGPDPFAEGPVDSIQAAQVAERSRMREIVLKSFPYNVVSDAYLIKKNLISGLRILGSVVIGCTTTGDLSHASETIEAIAKVGRKVAWFPAMGLKQCRSYLRKEGGISILKKDGISKDEILNILELVKQYDMVVCFGYMSYEENTKMFGAAIQKGITKMVATHPLTELGRFILDQIQELAAKGVYIEHVYGILMPRLGSIDPSSYVDYVKLVGADRCIMGTDLAQVQDMTPADDMRHLIAMMIQFGCILAEVEAMSKKNPVKSLGMEERQEEQ